METSIPKKKKNVELEKEQTLLLSRTKSEWVNKWKIS